MRQMSRTVVGPKRAAPTPRPGSTIQPNGKPLRPRRSGSQSCGGGVPADRVPEGVHPATAMLQAAKGAAPRRRTPFRFPRGPPATCRDVEVGGRDDPEDAECFSSPANRYHMLQAVAVSYCGRPVVR